MRSAALRAAIRRPSVVLPEPGGPQRISEESLPAAEGRAQQRFLADQFRLAHELFEAARRMRSASGASSGDRAGSSGSVEQAAGGFALH